MRKKPLDVYAVERHKDKSKAYVITHNFERLNLYSLHKGSQSIVTNGSLNRYYMNHIVYVIK